MQLSSFFFFSFLFSFFFFFNHSLWYLLKQRALAVSAVDTHYMVNKDCLGVSTGFESGTVGLYTF